MSECIEEGHDLGEFVSLELIEDPKEGTFIVELSGLLRYSDLIAYKLGQIRLTEEEISEWVAKS